MKYIASRNFETVSRAINFRTSDCRVYGSCDLYTTKAAKNDKKLYKSVEKSLQTQHESLVRLSASLSPPQSEMMRLNLDLARPSPFGSLSDVSNRRTFAYMIATLNASHPDYDFADVLKPSDFKKERSYRAVMSEIDDLLYNLRPRTLHTMASTSNVWSGKGGVSTPQTPGGTPTWNPRMWHLIDDEMTLGECEIYRYQPREDPFDGEGAIWSTHFFIFNKAKKRVAYLHLKGLSALSQSPTLLFSTHSNSNSQLSRSAGSNTSKRPRPVSISSLYAGDFGATKRARYWLGEQAEFREIEGPETIDDYDDEFYWGSDFGPQYTLSDDGSITEHYSDEDDEFAQDEDRPAPRAMSEEITTMMDP